MDAFKFAKPLDNEHVFTTLDKWMEYQHWINLSNDVNARRFWQWTKRNQHRWS